MYERGLLEMYKAWKAKKLERTIDSNVLNFFETHPTEEQIMLVSNISRGKDQHAFIWLAITFFGSIIFGILIGLLLVVE